MFAALHVSGCGTLLPRAFVAHFPKLMKADIRRAADHRRSGCRNALNDPDGKAKLMTAGVIGGGGTPEEFAAHIKSEMAKAEQLKAADIKPD